MQGHWVGSLAVVVELVLAAPAAGQQRLPTTVRDTITTVGEDADTALAVEADRRPSSVILKTPIPRRSSTGLSAGGMPSEEHVVQRGETLWGLASRYLGDPFRWRAIFDANRGVVGDPHWIFPRERLQIPGAEAASTADGSGSLGTVGRPSAGGGGAAASVKRDLSSTRERTRFYRTPPAPPELELDRDRPLVTVWEYRAAAWLDNPASLPVVARFLRVFDPGTSTGGDASPGAVHPQDAVYLDYAGAPHPAVGDSLLLVHVGRKVGRHGSLIEPSAVVRIATASTEVLKATVEHQFRMVEPGDLALPLPESPELSATATEPVEDGPTAEIVGFAIERSLPSVGDEAFVDIGAASGLGPGDELIAYLPTRSGGDPARDLPAEPVARLRVVRTTDRTATARVIALSEAVLQEGLPVRVYSRVR